MMEMKVSWIEDTAMWNQNNAKLLEKWNNPIKLLSDWPKTENLLLYFILKQKVSGIMETCQLKCISTLTSYIFNTGSFKADPTFGFKIDK